MKTTICLKSLTVLFFVLANKHTLAQAADTTMNKQSGQIITFVATFDAGNESKDGYYLNGYVVNIDHGKAKKLNGKKIRVTGTVTVVAGINSQPEARDTNGNVIIKQGRAEDTRHILNPTIDVVD
jgi:hypothetical protein